MQIFKYGPKEEQFAHLYRPDNDSTLPVVILIHGGYWKNNHSLDSYPTAGLIDYLLSLNVAVWNLEYRRMEAEGENTLAPWPAVFADVADGIDFLVNIAGPEGLDLSSVFTIGHSAGGCLALWAASRQQISSSSSLYKATPLVVARAMSIGGVIHFSNPQDLEQPQQIHRLIGGNVSQFPERYKASDPSLLCIGDIPIYLLHGEQDETVSIDQAYHFQSVCPGNLTFKTLTNGTHFSMLPHEGEWHADEWQTLKAFVCEMIGK